MLISNTWVELSHSHQQGKLIFLLRPRWNPLYSQIRFDMGEGQEETSIVTSSGNYVIAWDFKAIKRGKFDKYEIRR